MQDRSEALRLSRHTGADARLAKGSVLHLFILAWKGLCICRSVTHYSRELALAD